MKRLDGLWALGLLLPAFVPGCSCRSTGLFSSSAPWPLDVEVTIDSAGFHSQLGTIPSVEVNLVGVTDLELDQWRRLSMTTYWMPDNAQRLTALRGQLAHRMNFGDQRPTTLVLGKADPIWQRWASRGAVHLFVLANYPRACRDQPGNGDPRRLILPAQGKLWRELSRSGAWIGGRRGRIRLQITPAGILCGAPPESR